MNLLPHKARGFSLQELLVAVVILGILAGLMIDAGLRDWRRERVNTVTIELAGWLESVRRAALKGNSCQVQIVGAGGSPLKNGDQLATSISLAQDARNPLSLEHNCRSSQPLEITSLGNNSTFNVQVTAGSSTFTFTPAGTMSSNSSQDTVIRIALHDAPYDQARCIRLEGLLGFISVGQMSGSTCDTNGRF